MNTTEHTVTKVLSEPYFNYAVWMVDVEADSWGSIQKTTVYCKTKEQANSVNIGYKFEA
jgi:hypothetical protein